MMDDAYLCTLIDRERSQGIGKDDNIATDRQTAMEFYLGEPIGKLVPPQVEDRSRVVSKDLMETVEWIMPSLMRMFCGADDVIRFEPTEVGDEQACNDATEYCAYLLHRKNPGFTILHDAIKSALISRYGVVKVYCDRSWEEKEERYQGLSMLELQALQADDQVEIVEIAEVQDIQISTIPGMQPQQPPIHFDVRVKRKERQDRFVVDGIPPEEFVCSKDSRDVEKLRFTCHEVERTKSDLLSVGYDPDLVELAWGDNNPDRYDDAQARSYYDGVNTADDEPADISQRTITLCEVYMRVDYDGDGIAEYRRIVKAGKIVFENEVVDDHCFAVFSPVLMPYKLIGLSMYDLLEDLQVIKTHITRQLMDNMYFANTPRLFAQGEINLDDLLTPRPGQVVRGKPGSALSAIQTPDIAPSAQASITFFNQVRDSRTGVKEYTQGLVGSELSQSQIGSQGVAQLADAAAQRMELIARVLAETGMKRIFKLMLKLVTQYQDREAQIKINGRWLKIDPRAWKNEYDMTVSVGIGTSNKDRQLSQTMTLLQVQQQAASAGLVQPQNAYNALEDLCNAMGKRDVGRYFTAPQPGPAPKPPDPMQIQMQIEQAKLQMQGQLQQQKAQQDMQIEQAKQSFQAQQAAQETALEARRNELDAQNQMALAQFKANQEAQLARYKAELDAQTSIAIARINAEARIAAAQVSGAKDDANADSYIQYQEDNE